MPNTPESRERLAALEVEIKHLTEGMADTKAELRDTADAVRELTTALIEMKAGLKYVFMFGSFCTAALTAIGTGLWVAGTWVYEHLIAR